MYFIYYLSIYLCIYLFMYSNVLFVFANAVNKKKKKIIFLPVKNDRPYEMNGKCEKKK